MSTEYNHFPQLIDLINREISDILRTEPELISNDIKTAMNQPHSGRIYKRRSVEHQASAPGEAPAIDTGAYINSIQIKRNNKTASIQSNQQQALALELGRPEKNLLPRPAWIPAAKRSSQRIRRRMKALEGKIKNV